MTPEASVSCVVPTRDRPALLLEALGSVAAQTVPPFEVLVVDDGTPVAPLPVPAGEAAPDLGLSAMLARFAERSGLPVRHLAGGGRGASAARNLGARAAHGALLAFLDDDDRWQPRYLERALACRRDEGCAAVVTWIERFSATRRWPGRSVARGLRAEQVLARNPGVTGSNLVVERETFWRIGGYDEALPVSNDKDLFVRLLDVGVAYGVVEERLVGKRAHQGAHLGAASSRAQGLQAYRRKHAARLTRADRRILAADLADVTRRTAPTRLARLLATLTQLALLGPTGLRRRWLDQRPGLRWLRVG